MELVFAPFKKYATFKGRARRKEFWLFVLFSWLGLILLSVIAGQLRGIVPFTGLIGVYILFTILPFIAVLVRRFHDSGHSGWWVLFYFVPVIGMIWILVLTLSSSDPGTNQYGPNPKTSSDEDYEEDILDLNTREN